jgi:flagellar biosynthesis protein FliQ
MSPQDAVDLGREAVQMALVISSPILAAGLVVGLVIGLLQAMTQVQEQTVSFVPKLVAMGIALSLSLPWLVGQLVEYSRALIVHIPSTLH